MSILKSKLRKLSVATLFSAIIAMPTFANNADNQSAVPATAVEAAAEQKINLNNATAEELEKGLLGIGAKKAQAIVEYREKNGNFISVEQLADVSGIGKATVDKNRHLLSL